MGAGGRRELAWSPVGGRVGELGAGGGSGRWERGWAGGGGGREWGDESGSGRWERRWCGARRARRGRERRDGGMGWERGEGGS